MNYLPLKATLPILFFTLFTACTAKKNSGESNGTPACINKAITEFSKRECRQGLSVKEYTFQGKRVFVFDQSMCGNDMTSDVVDENCKPLGMLGGFAGNVKINGEDFSNALLVRTVWEK